MASPLPVPEVYFERLDEPDRVNGIARLLLRRARLKPHVLILCPDVEEMEKLDVRLWTISSASFLAHAVAGADAEVNAGQPILLATEIVQDNSPGVLINAGLEIPARLSEFDVIVDFDDAWSEPLRQASRERFRTYRQFGISPKYLGGNR